MAMIFDALWYVVSTIFGLVWPPFAFVASWVGIISLLTFVVALGVQHALIKFAPQRSLKARYPDAKWALVTGASSGIGRAIVEKLAADGVNVVLVALDDPTLQATFQALQKQFPAVELRRVGVNLGDFTSSGPGATPTYLAPIIDATKDVDVTLVFNNAGYILPGFFADSDLAKVRANFECNAACSIGITHHFVRRMLEKRQRGLIAFTSSAAAYLPGPTATLYSPTKAFLTNFAVTLAAEVKDAGIDVVCVHPSPVATNFYKTQGPQLDSLKQAQKGATGPMTIADAIFASAGRLTVCDQGAVCAMFRVANKVIDWQVFAEIVARLAWVNKDHQRLVKESKIRVAKSS